MSVKSPGPGFAGKPVFTAGIASSATSPFFQLISTGAALNQKNTLLRLGTTGNFAIDSATDAAPTTAVTDVFVGTRSGAAWSSVAFGNATDNPTYAFRGSGTIQYGGSTTGAQTATFTATNKPGAGTAGPIAWIPVLTTGGTAGYVPIFGA